jgi:hypothetical protein
MRPPVARVRAPARRGYLLVDPIKVTIKTARVNTST